MQKMELSEREQVIECIKALTRIDGINRYIVGNGLKQDEAIFESIDLIMRYFDRILRELDR